MSCERSVYQTSRTSEDCPIEESHTSHKPTILPATTQSGSGAASKETQPTTCEQPHEGAINCTSDV